MLSFAPGGEAGLYAILGPEGIDAGVNARVHALARALEGTAGITDLIPGYWNLYIEFDPNVSSVAALKARVRRLEPTLDSAPSSGRTHVIPVRYNGADLDDVAALTGLAPGEVISRHTARDYTVYAVGFTPGFPYLGTLESALHVPRLGTPRLSTPAHSVAIAGAQTGIYPLPSPGGWRVVGTALRRVFDPHRAKPVLLEPGDTVRFQADAHGSLEPAALPTDTTPEGTPVFAVLEAGLLSSIQDGGRYGVGRYGLARAGALDARAARVANALVGNAPGSAVVEMTLRGPTLRTLEPALVAIAGAGMGVRLNGRSLELNSSLAVKPGDTLEFPGAPDGVRAYLAVRGGFAGARLYGSTSTDLRAGLGGQALRSGGTLHRLEARGSVLEGRRWHSTLEPGAVAALRVTPGPQAHLFPPLTWRTLLEGTYRVVSGDRMGIRLEGPALEAARFDITSEGVPVGAVQVNSGGQLMLLLNDRGTLGGYAKIAVLRRSSLDVVAQLRPGARVRFALG